MKRDEGGRMKDELSSGVPQDYAGLLSDIKQRVRHAQTRAVLAVNAELIRLYWEIGAMIDRRQQQEGWGAGVIPRLARDLHNELPEEKGFSERNIKRMLAFYREYPHLKFVPQTAAQIESDSKEPQAAALFSARVIAEFTLRGVDKPIGVSSYELTRALPDSLQSSLPSIEQIERELEGIEP